MVALRRSRCGLTSVVCRRWFSSSVRVLGYHNVGASVLRSHCGRRRSKKTAQTPHVHLMHTPALSPAQQSLGLQQDVVAKAPRDKANTLIQREGGGGGGQLELLVTGSISRRCGTENRKGNVSFSPDTQNATSVGGPPAADRD